MCTIVTNNQKIGKSLRLLIKYAWEMELDPITISFEELMQILANLEDQQEIEVHTYLVDFDIAQREKGQILDVQNYPLDDPFYYEICNFLSTVVFDERFHKVMEVNDSIEIQNTFLSRMVFFGVFNQKNITNHFNGLLEYIEIPKNIIDLKKAVANVKIKEYVSKCTESHLNRLWEKMCESLRSAFDPH